MHSAAQDTPSDALVIGVDGGGTQTRAALAIIYPVGPPRVVASCSAGTGNLQSLPLDRVADHVMQAIGGLRGDGPPAPVAAIAFCMAGAGHEPLRQRFEDWARAQHLAERLVVTHDARALIEAGTPRGCGVALIAGTGSMAFARTPAGGEQRCGGWGSLIGDEGSGYWLALQGLRAACRAVDRRGPDTRLVSMVTQWLQCATPHQWPAKLRALQPSQLAAAAPLVCQAARDGDTVAADLLLACADELAQLIVPLARRCFATGPVDLALAGGLILHHDDLRRMVIDRVAASDVALGTVRDVRHPVEGAVRLAARIAASGSGQHACE